MRKVSDCDYDMRNTSVFICDTYLDCNNTVHRK